MSVFPGTQSALLNGQTWFARPGAAGLLFQLTLGRHLSLQKKKRKNNYNPTCRDRCAQSLVRESCSRNNVVEPVGKNFSSPRHGLRTRTREGINRTSFNSEGAVVRTNILSPDLFLFNARQVDCRRAVEKFESSLNIGDRVHQLPFPSRQTVMHTAVIYLVSSQGMTAWRGWSNRKEDSGSDSFVFIRERGFQPSTDEGKTKSVHRWMSHEMTIAPMFLLVFVSLSLPLSLSLSLSLSLDLSISLSLSDLSLSLSLDLSLETYTSFSNSLLDLFQLRQR